MNRFWKGRMNKINCSKCNKYRKLEKPKIWCIFGDKCGSKDEKIFKKEKSVEISKMFGFIKNI